MSCQYHDYYVNQAGTGIGAIYRGSIYQKGRGFGSFFKGILRTIMPLFKSGLKTVGKEALRSGSSFINDVINDVPPKEALKVRVGESVENLKRKAENKIDSLVGSGDNTKRLRLMNKGQKTSVRRGVKKLKSKTKSVNYKPDIFH